MNVYFVRHLKTLGNYEKRYIGSTDQDLFQPASQSITANLPATPTHIFTSPLKRCLQTTLLLYPNSPYITVDALREIDFGKFENKTYDELKHNENYRNFIAGIDDTSGGESIGAFKSRCVTAFLKITAALPLSSTIVIVCHGGTVMAIMESLDSAHLNFYDYQLANGHSILCSWDGLILRRTNL